MKSTFAIIFLLLITHACSFAQADIDTVSDKVKRKQELRENNEARKEAAKKKVEYNIFHRQIIALPEYQAEQKKLAELQKTSLTAVKLTAFIDTFDDAAADKDNNMLTGYIRQDNGEFQTNLYEVLFDRISKKIAVIRRTPEANEADKEANDVIEKAGEKKPTAKKKGEDGDDDDADEEKPSKGKHKEKDEE